MGLSLFEVLPLRSWFPCGLLMNAHCFKDLGPLGEITGTDSEVDAGDLLGTDPSALDGCVFGEKRFTVVGCVAEDETYSLVLPTEDRKPPGLRRS